MDPLGRSRLKSEIDAQGEIKVVKFPVSINAAELHKSARNGSMFLRFDHRNIDTVHNARPLVERGQYFPAPRPPTLVIYFSQKIDARRDLAPTLSLPFSFSLLLSGNSRYARFTRRGLKFSISELLVFESFLRDILSNSFFKGGNMRSKMNVHFESMIR